MSERKRYCRYSPACVDSLGCETAIHGTRAHVPHPIEERTWDRPRGGARAEVGRDGATPGVTCGGDWPAHRVELPDGALQAELDRVEQLDPAVRLVELFDRRSHRPVVLGHDALDAVVQPRRADHLWGVRWELRPGWGEVRVG